MVSEVIETFEITVELVRANMHEELQELKSIHTYINLFMCLPMEMQSKIDCSVISRTI